MTPIPLLIAITFLLSFSPPTTAATDSVLDTKGHPLKPDTSYYILPVYRGRGGGLTMSPKNTTTPCPLYAAQDPLEVSKGKPVKFYPVNYPTQNKITLSTDMNFVFAAFPTGCRQSTGWQLKVDEETERRYVGLGVVTAPPGPATVSNWFRVDKSSESGEYDYKIVFCPGVCNFCKVLCGDVGVFVNDDGKRLLGFSGLGSAPQTLLVRFLKAQNLTEDGHYPSQAEDG